MKPTKLFFGSEISGSEGNVRDKLLNTWFLLLMILVIAFLSIWKAFGVSDPLWFSRGGALITVLGLLLTVKHSILSSGRDLDSIVNEKFHYAVYAPSPGDERWESDRLQAKKIMRDEYIGIVTTIIGTVIWGYGDLILEKITQ